MGLIWTATPPTPGQHPPSKKINSKCQLAAAAAAATTLGTFNQ